MSLQAGGLVPKLISITSMVILSYFSRAKLFVAYSVPFTKL